MRTSLRSTLRAIATLSRFPYKLVSQQRALVDAGTIEVEFESCRRAFANLAVTGQTLQRIELTNIAPHEDCR